MPPKHEIVQCIVCEKEYKRLTRIGSRAVGYRRINAVTCSGKCSKVHAKNHNAGKYRRKKSWFH